MLKIKIYFIINLISKFLECFLLTILKTVNMSVGTDVEKLHTFPHIDINIGIFSEYNEFHSKFLNVRHYYLKNKWFNIYFQKIYAVMRTNYIAKLWKIVFTYKNVLLIILSCYEHNPDNFALWKKNLLILQKKKKNCVLDDIKKQ